MLAAIISCQPPYLEEDFSEPKPEWLNNFFGEVGFVDGEYFIEAPLVAFGESRSSDYMSVPLPSVSNFAVELDFKYIFDQLLGWERDAFSIGFRNNQGGNTP